MLGVANRQSIAYGCAAAFRFLGAELALTYLDEKAKPHVQPIVDELGAPIFMPCNVEAEGELEAVFEATGERWGHIDFALHSIAFAPREDLHGRYIDSSGPGFARPMDISCHSFVRMARLADSIPKLKGLAKYAATDGETFRRIDAVAKVGDDFRVLDLKEESVRPAIESAAPVKALYESAAADDYVL